MKSIRPLFDKYKRELVSFCNTDSGRHMLAKYGAKEALEKFPIIVVSPDGFTQLMDVVGGIAIKRSVFHSRSPFLKVFAEQLTKLSLSDKYLRRISPEKKSLVIPHFMGDTTLLRSELPLVFLTESTFNPDAGTGSTTCDAAMFRHAVDETLATIRAGAGTLAQDTNAEERYWGIRASTTSGQYQQLGRGACGFDSSSIPDSDVISAGSYSCYLVDELNGMSGDASTNSQSVLVSFSPATDNDFEPSDYGSFGSTEFGNTGTQSTLSMAAHNAITMNASGLAAISKTGVTNLGVRVRWDLDNTETGLTWTSTGNQQVRQAFADDATAAKHPKLVVTHAAAAADEGQNLDLTSKIW